MRRYHITYGALTTVGGQVISASGNGAIDDKRVVIEGDIITCPACKSTGYVLCIGPRIPEFWGEGVGKPVALENDLCICKCSSPPRLIANQSLRAQTIEGVADMGGYGPASDIPSVFDDGYDQHFYLADEVTSKPLAKRFYRMTCNGRVVEGYTDGNGRTTKVEADDPADVKIEIFPEGYAGALA